MLYGYTLFFCVIPSLNCVAQSLGCRLMIFYRWKPCCRRDAHNTPIRGSSSCTRHNKCQHKLSRARASDTARYNRIKGQVYCVIHVGFLCVCVCVWWWPCDETIITREEEKRIPGGSAANTQLALLSLKVSHVHKHKRNDCTTSHVQFKYFCFLHQYSRTHLTLVCCVAWMRDFVCVFAVRTVALWCFCFPF